MVSRDADSWSTAVSGGSSLQREEQRRERAPSPSIKPSIYSGDGERKGEQKNEGCVVSHVWARTGVLGPRRAATLARPRIIECSLWLHTPAGISIYLCMYVHIRPVHIHGCRIHARKNMHRFAGLNLQIRSSLKFCIYWKFRRIRAHSYRLLVFQYP